MVKRSSRLTIGEKKECKQWIFGAITGEVGVKMMEVLLLDTATEALRIAPKQDKCKSHINQHETII